MTLAVRADDVRELMDDPHCDPVRLAATLRRFGLVNRLVSGWGTVYRTHLAPRLASLGRPARVLDLGSGGGDLVARLSGLALRDGLDVQWTGADPDARAHDVAVARRIPGATFRCADAAQLLQDGDVYDIVVSNHVLHHLGADVGDFVAASRLLAREAVLHGDIARGRRAYALYAVGILPFAAGTFLRVDGLRSIRRSFTPDELTAAVDEAWRVETPVPFRLLATAAGAAS